MSATKQLLLLKDFLRNAKKRLPLILESASTEKVSIVIGNQSGDCDSIVSSILHAYYLTHIRLTSNGHGNMIFPVLSMPEKDLTLRGAESLLLKECGIEISDLIFTDQIPWANVSNMIDKVTLVDHNVLSDSMSFLEPFVQEIIDHHKDEGLYAKTVENSKRKIEMVGSTTTLIAENFLNNQFLNKTVFSGVGNSHDDGAQLRDVDTDEHSNSRNISYMLFSTILLDTMDLSPEAKKATKKDIDIVNYIQKYFGDFDRSKTFKKLHSAKFDPEFWLSLSTMDKLRLDYKQYSVTHTLGISAVLIPFRTFIEDDGFVDDCAAFMKKNSLQMLVIMTMTLKEGNVPSREILVLSLKGCQDLFEKTISCIEDSNLQAEVQLEDIFSQLKFDHQNTNIKCYKQGLVTGSRKVVAPLLKNLL
eukprot:g13774.t1